MDLEEKRLRWIWRDMRSRCSRSTHMSYASYGGRGITVCERWEKSFKSFLLDMGPRPSRKYSIDRRNNNGAYSPENCRWVTRHVQNMNKRIYKNSPLGIKNIGRAGSGYKVRLRRNGEMVVNKTFRNLEQAKKFKEEMVNIYG